MPEAIYDALRIWIRHVHRLQNQILSHFKRQNL